MLLKCSNIKAVAIKLYASMLPVGLPVFKVHTGNWCLLCHTGIGLLQLFLHTEHSS